MRDDDGMFGVGESELCSSSYKYEDLTSHQKEYYCQRHDLGKHKDHFGNTYCIFCKFERLTGIIYGDAYSAREAREKEETNKVWSLSSLERMVGIGTENIAAYQCPSCGCVVPVELSDTRVKPPKEITVICGKRYGGCGSVTTMTLDSDGFIDRETGEGE